MPENTELERSLKYAELYTLNHDFVSTAKNICPDHHLRVSSSSKRQEYSLKNGRNSWRRK